MKLAITGATGNMGMAVMEQLCNIDEIEHLKLLVRSKNKVNHLLKKCRPLKNKVELIYGSIADKNICKKLVEGVDYVINMCAVIPPKSDSNPQSAITANEKGAYNLVDAIENITENQPKFIHISTLALYGNRNYLHPWAKVGDPLLVSPYDVYSVTKLRGEFRVLESNIKQWAIIRQTAMLHDKMLTDNLSDGLMFHTCFNSPIEWVTAHDSGVLIANILKKDIKEDLGETFWKKCFNLGGGAFNRQIGYDVLNDGFALIGGSGKDFFLPTYNATRNFHGLWFSDGDKLNSMFNYISQTTTDYWKRIAKLHPYYSLGKIVPKSLICTFAIKRLFKNYNSPHYWAKHNDENKLIAYFGSKQSYENLPVNWKDFDLLSDGKVDSKNIDYESLRNTPTAINYGFDFDKDDRDITISDLQSVAEAHGGKLISSDFVQGDLYKKLDWQTQDGEIFTATAYTVLRAGHWFNSTYTDFVWDFDRLAKKDKIYAQVWYDSHGKDENYVYSLDENFNTMIKIGE